MKNLREIHEEWCENSGGVQPISPVNIDDIIWYAKAQGIKQLGVLPSDLNAIWQFLSANVSVSDTELRRQYFVEGTCPRIIGVDIEVLPYTGGVV